MRVHRSVYVSCLLAAALTLLVQPVKAQSIVGPIDPVEADDNGKAVFDVVLKNGGATAIPLQISLSPFKSEADQPLRVKAKLTLDPLGDALQPNKVVKVHVEAEAKWPAGESTANLRNGTTLLSAIKIDGEPTLGVTPIGWNENAPLALRLQDGAATYLRLANPNGMPWHLQWTMTVDGKALTKQLNIGPREPVKTIEIPHAAAWFPISTMFQTLFRDEDVPARLTLIALRGGKLHPLWPSREFDVTFHRSYWSSVGRSWIGSGVLVLVLLAGGLCSLLVTNFLPNWRRKTALIKRITTAVRDARALPDEVSSLARVRARVDAQQLLDEIEPRWTLSSDFLTFVKVWEQDVDILERRVQLLGDIGRAFDEIACDADHFAPSQLTRAGDRLGDAQRILGNNRPKEAMLVSAKAAVDEATTIIRSLESPTDEMKTRLSARVKESISRLNSKAIQDVLAAPVANVREYITDKYTDASEINSDNYCRIDAAVAKLELISDFVAATEKVEVDDKTRASFAERLNSDEFAGHRSARQLAYQLKQRATSARTKEAIAKGEFTIDVDPPAIEVTQSAMFKIVFADDDLNTHAARFGINCEWNFGDSFREKGWQVAHYFRAPQEHEVSVRFFEAGTEIAGVPAESAKRRIEVYPPARDQILGNQTWLDLARLAILIGLAILGLLAGAKEQIAQIDLLPGLITVFTLGFSADQIKNVLAPKD